MSGCPGKVVPGKSCQIVKCEQECGAQFHFCKTKEHLLLCPNLKLPCINVVYGCPFNILRRDRGTHLESCPASVIPCNVEWNRWPLCSQERKAHIPFPHLNPQLREEQLGRLTNIVENFVTISHKSLLQM